MKKTGNEKTEPDLNVASCASLSLAIIFQGLCSFLWMQEKPNKHSFCNFSLHPEILPVAPCSTLTLTVQTSAFLPTSGWLSQQHKDEHDTAKHGSQCQ